MLRSLINARLRSLCDDVLRLLAGPCKMDQRPHMHQEAGRPEENGSAYNWTCRKRLKLLALQRLGPHRHRRRFRNLVAEGPKLARGFRWAPGTVRCLRDHPEKEVHCHSADPSQMILR